MEVPIKSKDGIETYMFAFQVLDFDPVKGEYTVQAWLDQKDAKGFTNPERVELVFNLTNALSAQITDAVVEEYNNPKPEDLAPDK
jgi:hypothetical protein